MIPISTLFLLAPMDPSIKDVPESMKLVGPSNYVIWSYKVKMILLQEGLWRFVEPATGPSLSASATSTESFFGITTAATEGALHPHPPARVAQPQASIPVDTSRDTEL